MIKKNQNVAELHAQNVDNTRELLHTSLDSFETITNLQLEASKKILESASKAIKHVSQADSPEEFFNSINELTSESVTSQINHFQELCSVMTNIQGKLNKLITAHTQNTQEQFSNHIEQFTQYKPSNINIFSGKHIPTGADWFGNAQKTVENIKSVTEELQQITQKNLRTMVEKITPKKTPNK